MSFVRWSKDSDVYVYEDTGGGFTTHVTDGEDFNHATTKECADNLVELRKEGHSVPQYAIDNLMEEALNEGQT